MRHPYSIQTLRTAIENYHPFDAAEEAHKLAVLDLFRQQDDPLDSLCYEPGHATGSAWVVSRSTKQVAMIYHQNLKRWLQPGGHTEPNEQDLRITSLREAQEELGIHLDSATLLDLDVHPIPESRKHPSHLHYDFRYLCLTEFQPLNPATDAELAQWFTLAELEALPIEDPGIRRMIHKTISLLS
jgi:8-oxo-dGTP pyrophosphatase MutT (NUDIX family)